jgi:hypothetical protein
MPFVYEYIHKFEPFLESIIILKMTCPWEEEMSNEGK